MAGWAELTRCIAPAGKVHSQEAIFHRTNQQWVGVETQLGEPAEDYFNCLPKGLLKARRYDALNRIYHVFSLAPPSGR